MVLLPAPAGPSMAMISLRSGMGVWSVIEQVDDCTRSGLGNDSLKEADGDPCTVDDGAGTSRAGVPAPHNLSTQSQRTRAFSFTRGSGRGLATTGSFAGVICSIDRPLTCTKLSSRAASSAFTASFTRERATKFPKKVSSSVWSAATTQSRYFESNADSACCTDSPTPSLTASGDQR